MDGTIKKLVPEKGFGFISQGSEKDLFFHKESLVGMQFSDLNEGDKVTFSVEDSPKGPRAANVQKA